MLKEGATHEFSRSRTSFLGGGAVLIAASLAAGAILSAGAGESGGQLTGTLAGNDITWNMPPGWFMQPVFGASPEVIGHYSYYRGGLPYCEMFLSCEILATPKTLDEAFAEAMEKAKPALPLYQARGTQRTMIAGLDAIVHEFSFYMVQGVPFAGRAYTLIVNGGLYSFLFNATSSNFDTFRGVFPQIIDSVKRNPKAAAPAGQIQGQAQAQVSPEKKAPKTLPSPTGEPTSGSAVFTDPDGRIRIPLPDGAEIFRYVSNLTSYKFKDKKAYFQIWTFESPSKALGMEAYAASEQWKGKLREKAQVWVVAGAEVQVKFYAGKDSVDDDAVIVPAVYPEHGLFVLIEVAGDGFEASWAWIKSFIEGARFSKT